VSATKFHTLHGNTKEEEEEEEAVTASEVSNFQNQGVNE